MSVTRTEKCAEKNSALLPTSIEGGVVDLRLRTSRSRAFMSAGARGTIIDGAPSTVGDEGDDERDEEDETVIRDVPM